MSPRTDELDSKGGRDDVAYGNVGRVIGVYLGGG